MVDVPVQIYASILFIQIWLYFYDLPTYLKAGRAQFAPVCTHIRLYDPPRITLPTYLHPHRPEHPNQAVRQS